MAAKDLTVSIIIPNYNGEKLLKKNLLKVIKECQFLNLCQEIIIVDDGSTDRSVEQVKSLIRQLADKVQSYSLNLKIKLIENKKNLGFASAVNRGVKEAKSKIVVLLNTDVYPERGFLEAVLPHFQDEKVFAVGMMDKSIEGEKIVLRGRGIGDWQKGFYVHRRGEVDKTNTDWVAGGSGAFRRSIFLKLGGFAEVFNPFYWEDIDLSYRAVRAGYKILFEPKAKVVHEHEKGAIKKKYGRFIVNLIAFRNQFLFVWRNANFYQWLSHLFWLPYHLIFSTLRTRGLFLLGFFWALARALKFSTVSKSSKPVRRVK